MTERNTLIRSLHDLGLAAWFGGALMGAIGLNGAAAKAKDPTERTRLSALGWKMWAPANAAAIGVHAVGGAGLILANRRRVEQQDGVLANTTTKAAITVVAAGLTAYSGTLGARVEQQSQQGARGATEPAAGAGDDLAAAQRQLKVAQWVVPALTGVLIALAAQQGEQQRPLQQLASRLGSGRGNR